MVMVLSERYLDGPYGRVRGDGLLYGILQNLPSPLPLDVDMARIRVLLNKLYYAPRLATRLRIWWRKAMRNAAMRRTRIAQVLGKRKR